MDKGLQGYYKIAGVHINKGFILSMVACILFASHGIVFVLGLVSGWDRGYDVAIREVNSSLKEQLNERRPFRLRGIESKFHPRKDGAVNYTIAGAGSDTPVRGKN